MSHSWLHRIGRLLTRHGVRRAPERPGPVRLRRRPAPRRALRDAGMATAEYAIATLAACGFAAVLIALLRSAEVRDLLFGIIKRALAAV